MERKKNNRTKILNLRLTEAEYRLLKMRFRGTIQRKFSDYARAVLFSRPVVAGHRDLVMDDMLTELSALRKDLNGIANNVNQAVHKLHTMDNKGLLGAWISGFEKQHEQALQHMGAIRLQVNKIAEKWLQK